MFPGIFRGLLDHRVPKVTEAIKIKAAETLADLVESPTAEKIIPDPFDPAVPKAMAQSVLTSA